MLKPELSGGLRAALIAAAVAGGAGAFATTAQAGQRTNGSAAPSEGWSSFVTGSPGIGSNNGTECAPGQPMYAILSTDAAASAGSTEKTVLRWS